MVAQLGFAAAAIIVSLAITIFYFAGANFVLDRATQVPDNAVDPAKDTARRRIRPWLFVLPALMILGIYLLYPVFETIRLSLYNRDGTVFVGLANYRWAFSDGEFLLSIRNNLLWLIVVPTLSTFFGLIIAVMTDRIWWGTIAKSLIFMPMAISFVGASVIWKFVYDYRSAESVQIGILNAIVTSLGFEPQAWITIPFWNNFFLMVILVWIQTGFAMVILAAALRGIPEDTLEAARIDGASELKIFTRIMVPQMMGTILVVWTTITIIVLKVFDIVLAMTNGQWDTEVLANLMFDWMFRGGGDFGRGSAVALFIMLGVLPIMIWNIRRLRREMQ